MQKCHPCVLGAEELGYSHTQTADPARRLEKPLQIFMCAEFRSALANAELTEEISEFSALCFQAVLAIAEGSEFALDYLEMSSAAAASTSESTIVASIQNAYDLAQDDPDAASERCLTIIGQLCQTEELCRGLIIAVARLGDVKVISAVERGVALQAGVSTAQFMETLHLQRAPDGTDPKILIRRTAG